MPLLNQTGCEGDSERVPLKRVEQFAENPTINPEAGSKKVSLSTIKRLKRKGLKGRRVFLGYRLP